MWTNRSGSLNGRPRRKRSLIKLKIAVLSPMPSARVRTAIAAKAGALVSVRQANRKSLSIYIKRLLGPQGLDRIDHGRPPGRQQAGEQRRRGKKYRGTA